MRTLLCTIALVLSSFIGCGIEPERIESAELPIVTDEPCVVASDCRAFGKPCLVAKCSLGLCEYEPVKENAPCNSGIGVCTASGSCITSMLMCKEHDGPEPRTCTTADDCDDGSPCTDDKCVDGWCAHAPMNGSVTCGPGLSCDWGECCSAPYAVCEPIGDCMVSPDWTLCGKDGKGVCVGGLCCHD